MTAPDSAEATADVPGDANVDAGAGAPTASAEDDGTAVTRDAAETDAEEDWLTEMAAGGVVTTSAQEAEVIETLEREVAAAPVDDEGTPTRPVPVQPAIFRAPPAPAADAAPGGAAAGTAVKPGAAESAPVEPAPAGPAPVQWVDGGRGATALTWIDPATVAESRPQALFDEDVDPEPGAALLRGARLRPAIARPGVLVPLGILTGLVAAYAGTTLLWPLHEVAPAVQAAEIAPTPAPPAAVTWPAQGSAAVGVDGIGTASSSLDPAVIASVTKVVSSLMVLDRMPLAPGEQGPEFAFTRADNLAYWQYRRDDQSALDVPVGGTLTELQLLQGTLMGSANNYIDRLSDEIWGSDREFAAAAEIWLRDRGIEGITVATPSGFDERNTATPAALIALADTAMRNPVFASIVGTKSVDLPGAGTVVNTNGMLADAGVVGIKTGTLEESWNLLTAKDVTVGDTTVRLYAAVLGQADDDQRLAATRALFEQVEAELRAQPPAVAEGTVVGTVETLWGAKAEIVTDADADVVLWDAASARATAEIDLGDRREEGDEVGTLTTAGPLGTVTTALTLAEDIEAPSPWWRLTHPLELLGLADSQR